MSNKKGEPLDKSVKFEIFDIKQKFLREIPHPKLILKQIKFLAHKGEFKAFEQGAAKLLLGQSDLGLPLVVFLNGYITETLRLKQSIANASNYKSLHDTLAELYILQWGLIKKLQSYLPEVSEYPDKEVKMSAPIDAYAIIKRIETLNLKENGIKPYLCKEIEAGDLLLPDVLVTACLQAGKILSHA